MINQHLASKFQNQVCFFGFLITKVPDLPSERRPPASTFNLLRSAGSVIDAALFSSWIRWKISSRCTTVFGLAFIPNLTCLPLICMTITLISSPIEIASPIFRVNTSKRTLLGLPEFRDSYSKSKPPKKITSNLKVTLILDDFFQQVNPHINNNYCIKFNKEGCKSLFEVNKVLCKTLSDFLKSELLR